MNPEELPPLPEDFQVPDHLIDNDMLLVDVRKMCGVLATGRDARPLLFELAAANGDHYAVLAVKWAQEYTVAFILNEATVREAFEITPHLGRLLVTAREIALRAA